MVTWLALTVNGIALKLASTIDTVPDVFMVDVMYKLIRLPLSCPVPSWLAPWLWAI